MIFYFWILFFLIVVVTWCLLLSLALRTVTIWTPYTLAMHLKQTSPTLLAMFWLSWSWCYLSYNITKFLKFWRNISMVSQVIPSHFVNKFVQINWRQWFMTPYPSCKDIHEVICFFNLTLFVLHLMCNLWCFRACLLIWLFCSRIEI